MPETNGGTVHPGSWVGDATEEFKKLPPWGKGLVIVGVGVAGYLGYRAYQNRGASTGAAGAAGAAGGTPGGGAQSPFPMIGNVPLLPSGVNPIYDPSGGLIGFQNQPPPTPPTPNPQPPPTTPPPTSPGPAGPLIPFGQYQGPSYSNLKPGTYYNYQGTNYLLSTGPSGRLYGTANGKQTLLYAPKSAYPQGSGGFETSALMEKPTLYHQRKDPHISSASAKYQR